jgi:hypothetical protein
MRAMSQQNMGYRPISRSEMELMKAEIIFEALEHIADVMPEANNRHYESLMGPCCKLLSNAPFTRALVDTLRVHMLRMDANSRLCHSGKTL